MPATPDDRPSRLVFLHGFTQTHHHWHRCAGLVADRLGGHPSIAFVDLPGHGLSGGDRLGIAESAAPLCELAGPATYVGYSMGGRFALNAAVDHPGTIERLVLIGATPGIDHDGDRVERRRLDRERADRVERVGVDTFLDEWLAAPLFGTLPVDDVGLEHRRRNTAAGLAHSLRTCGTGDQGTLWPRLDELTIPVLVLAGELDTKFTAIGRRMTDQIADATFIAVADAGHAAHTERPRAVAEAIADWLDRQPSASPTENSSP